jgi:hypothetical protein
MTKSVAALLNQGAPPVNADRLEHVRIGVRALRNTEQTIADLEEQLKTCNEELQRLQREELPALFHEAGIQQLTLEPEGNNPAYAVKLSPYYYANIAAKAPDEQKAKAFEWLEAHEAGDLVKRTISVVTARGEEKKAAKVTAALSKLGIPFEVKREVPWSTLTAWLRESVINKTPLPPLELIGGVVGEVVKVEKARAKR